MILESRHSLGISGLRSRKVAAVRYAVSIRANLCSSPKAGSRGPRVPKVLWDLATSARSVHFAGFRGSTSSDNCVLTFRSQACLTVSVEERPGPSAPLRPGGGGAPGSVSYSNPGVLQQFYTLNTLFGT